MHSLPKPSRPPAGGAEGVNPLLASAPVNGLAILRGQAATSGRTLSGFPHVWEIGAAVTQGTTRTLKEVTVTLAAEVKLKSLVPRLSAGFRAAEESVSVKPSLPRVDFSSLSG
jgi:hypothetical protein